MARQSHLPKSRYGAWGYSAVSKHWSFPPKLVEMPDGQCVDATPLPGRSYVWGVNWPIKGRGRGEAILSARRVQARLRAQQAVELRWAGHTWAQIASALGFKCPSGAWRAVRRETDRCDYAVWLKKQHREWR